MATTTITTTAAQDTRLLAAFRDLLGMPSATALQVQAAFKQWLIAQAASVVVAYEDRLNKAAVPQPAAFDPS